MQDLKKNCKTLYFTSKLTGSLCSEASTGETLTYLQHCVKAQDRQKVPGIKKFLHYKSLYNIKMFEGNTQTEESIY